MPYGQNLRVKKARAGSEAKNNARSKELMEKKKVKEAGSKAESKNNSRRKELMEKQKSTAKDQAIKNKTKKPYSKVKSFDDEIRNIKEKNIKKINKLKKNRPPYSERYKSKK